MPFHFSWITEENQVVYSCDGENWNRFTNHCYAANDIHVYGDVCLR